MTGTVVFFVSRKSILLYFPALELMSRLVWHRLVWHVFIARAGVGVLRVARAPAAAAAAGRAAL